MKKDYYVAPYILKSQYDLRSLDAKINMYERRLDGWFIKIAKALKNDPSELQGGPGADPVALMIVMSLFEAHGVYLQGKNTQLDSNRDPKSKINFKYGFLEFLSKKYPQWSQQQREDVALMIYIRVRCGLFHLNNAKKGVWYDRGSDEEHSEPPMKPTYYKKKLTKITFNVPAFVLEVEGYFQEYIANLQNDKTQRRCFSEGWKIINSSLSRV